MPLLPRPLVAGFALVFGTFPVGCSHEHGPLSDKPDTTSLGTAGRFGDWYVSASWGLAREPKSPEEIVPGTVQGETSPLTTRAQPPVTLLGTRADWNFGQTVAPETGWAMNTWTSGPNLPVEPWNMALEPPTGEGGEGHGAPKSNHPRQ